MLHITQSEGTPMIKQQTHRVTWRLTNGIETVIITPLLQDLSTDDEMSFVISRAFGYLIRCNVHLVTGEPLEAP